MSRSRWSALAMTMSIACALGTPAWADVWEAGVSDDAMFDTPNRLMHGAVQMHDMAAKPGPVIDVDWYLVVVPPYSSFEAQVDGVTSEIGALRLRFERYDAAGNLVQNGQKVGSYPGALRLDWENASNAEELTFLKVSDPDCRGGCTANSQYTIRAKDTTVAVARFNNTSSQTTVLLTQNVANQLVEVSAHFWDTDGTLLSTASFTLPAHGLNVMNTNTGAQAGKSGHITLSHNAPYGMLNAKASALEPATGFSFDTPGVIRP